MKKFDPDDPTAGWCGLGQGHLKKMDRTLHTNFVKSKPTQDFIAVRPGGMGGVTGACPDDF